MAIGSDMEGYYCLVIAILQGVNAREAGILYEYGQNNPASQKILQKRAHGLHETSMTRKKRREAIRGMRAEGHSAETIAEVLGCDASTVKRNLKQMEVKYDEF